MTEHTDSTDITQATVQPEALVMCQTPCTAFGVNYLKAERSPKGPWEMAEEHAQGCTAKKQSWISNCPKRLKLHFIIKPKSIGLTCSQL